MFLKLVTKQNKFFKVGMILQLICKYLKISYLRLEKIFLELIYLKNERNKLIMDMNY